jgi:WD40 repeat protein
VAFAPDGKTVASSGEDKTVKVWRTADGALLHTLRGHARNVWHVAFSPDGQHIASGSFDKVAKLWRADTGALEHNLVGSGEAIVSLAFSPDGRLLATGGDDSSVRLWRVSDGHLMKTIPAYNHVFSVAFSPDGQWLATGGRARSAVGTFWHQLVGDRFSGANPTSVRLWRVSDGALLQSLNGHSDDVISVAFSPDGKLLATGSEDHTMRLWRLVTRAVK